MELQNALGRSDIEVDAGENHWVLDFKFTCESNLAEGLCREGVEQVKTRRYGELFERKSLRRMVLVFVQREKSLLSGQR